MPKQFTARNDEDLIALAPVVLGFQPENSIVMLTFGGPHTFHARIDVPTFESDYADCVGALLEPSKRHSVARVAFVLFDDNPSMKLKSVLLESFMQAGIDIICGLEVKNSQFKRFDSVEWKPLDIASSPITLEAAFMDVPANTRTRDELAEFLKPVGEPPTVSGAIVKTLIERYEAEGVITKLTRTNAREYQQQLIEALRSCSPDDPLVSDIAVCLAFASWLVGDGASAWVAVDQSQTIAWADMMRDILSGAVPPSRWPEG